MLSPNIAFPETLGFPALPGAYRIAQPDRPYFVTHAGNKTELWRNSPRQEVLAAAENERCNIAREMHDVLGQYVTALRFGLDNLAYELECGQPDTASVMKLQSLVEQFDQEFHHVALKLRPPMPGNGLKAAVVQYALEWAERSGVQVDLDSAEEYWHGLSSDTEVSLYRILQEALNNIQKYAQARRVSVILERRHGYLQLVIEDDGCGLTQPPSGGLPTPDEKSDYRV